jgi:hypothetical protein
MTEAHAAAFNAPLSSLIYEGIQQRESQILEARYEAKETWADVTATIANLVVGDRLEIPAVENRLFATDIPVLEKAADDHQAVTHLRHGEGSRHRLCVPRAARG